MDTSCFKMPKSEILNSLPSLNAKKDCFLKNKKIPKKNKCLHFLTQRDKGIKNLDQFYLQMNPFRDKKVKEEPKFKLLTSFIENSQGKKLKNLGSIEIIKNESGI